MEFLESIASGQAGVRLLIPSSWELLKQHPNRALWRSADDAVAWEITRIPDRFHLRAEIDPVLRADLERDARRIFEQTVPTPRTSDPSWSPVISMKRIMVGTAPSLLLLHRLSYEPTNEVIAGRLIIPLVDGTCEIVAYARATMTGLRESMLMNKLMAANPERDPGELMPTQEQIDDPSADIGIDPLSQVRTALAWLTDQSDVQVTTPMPAPVDGEVELAQSNCAVTPPPRFLLASHLRMSPTLSMFMRIGIPRSSGRSLDVWHVGHRIDGRNPAKELRRQAINMTENWENEGASDIEIRVVELPVYQERVQLDLYVRFRALGDPTHVLARWFVDTDGEVFRISIGGPPDLARSEFEADLEVVAKSWRRLGEVGPPVERRRRFGIF